MVTIRRLKPSVQIRMPTKGESNGRGYRADNMRARVHTVRTRAQFPPPTPQPEPCVLWQGAVDRFGYGVRKYTRDDGKRVTITMHRWVMEQITGRRLRKDQVILHACDNPPCYRASHLSIGTLRSNNEDMYNKGRLVHVAQHLPGERNGKAKLSNRQADHIRRMYRDGLRTSTIAEHYGISRYTVARIVKGTTYATGPPKGTKPTTR